jgi:quinone-modifying oxidoreductase subunit QmoA
MNHPILVLGGGIGGLTAALELAETGKEVLLVEREPCLGGNVSRFHNYFPKLCPPACGLEINYRRLRSNSRITILTGTTLTRLTGRMGNFEATFLKKPELINDNCTSCGKCAEVCPVLRSGGIGSDESQKAAYLPGGIPFPMRYTIDETVCRKSACGNCLDACEFQAIQLEAEPVEMVRKVHAIIMATGWQPYDVRNIENYRYEKDDDVITNLEFEYLLNAARRDQKALARPSDGKRPDRIAFVQCAGSRDRQHLPYCSAVCCSASVKHALTLAEDHDGITSEIFYIDLRLTGRNEVLLRKADQHEAISMTKGKVGRISRGNSGDELILEVEDVMNGIRKTGSFELVVLAAGLVPNPSPLALNTGPEGFFTQEQSEGIYPAGSCKRPMDVATTVRDATAAAIKAMHL